MAAGISSEGLDHLHQVMSTHVGAGEMPGLVTLVAMGDEVHVDALGTPSFLTRLRWPIGDLPHRLLDEADHRGRGRCLSSTTAFSAWTSRSTTWCRSSRTGASCARSTRRSTTLCPRHRSITVEDLLSFRFGFGSVMAPPDAYPIQRAEAAVGLQSIGGPPWPPVAHDVDSWMAALGSLPLMYQPGSQWRYNTSASVLGALLARATGKDIETVMRERIFDPLAMHDTGFTVPAEKLGRFTTAYASNPETGELSVLDDPSHSWWSIPPSFPDAAGMLVSTNGDFWAAVNAITAG